MGEIITPGRFTPSESEAVLLPGIEPEHYQPGQLVWYDRTPAPARSRGRNGPAPVLQRLFLECMMAVSIHHRDSRVDVRVTLGELVRFLWPRRVTDEQGRRTVHPTKTSYQPYQNAAMLQEALLNLSWYCVLETETGLWKPAVVRQAPKGYTTSHFNDLVIFDIRMPEGYGPGPRVHRPTLRKWGRSSLGYRSILSIADYWNRYITGGGKDRIARTATGPAQRCRAPVGPCRECDLGTGRTFPQLESPEGCQAVRQRAKPSHGPFAGTRAG